MELKLREIDSLQPHQIRDFLVQVERKIQAHPQSLNGAALKAVVKTSHSFCDGMYVRECFIPKGHLVMGMIHRHEHPVFLIKGEAKVLTESDGVVALKAPWHSVSPALTKRMVLALTDTIWVTTHLNPDNCRNIEELERRLVAESYEDLKEAS